MAPSLPAFLDSLGVGEPPIAATPLLRAVWYGLHGEWNAAHDIAQKDDSADGAWVHAWLHRIEGDLSNAGYWYRRARRPVAQDDTRIGRPHNCRGTPARVTVPRIDPLKAKSSIL